MSTEAFGQLQDDDIRDFPKTRFHRYPQNPISQDSWYVIALSHLIGTHHKIIRRLHYSQIADRLEHIRAAFAICMVDSSKVCVHLCWLRPQKLWLRTLYEIVKLG
eukprot:COSAG02_NODE_790_length_17186_cov_791.824603_8_plen_105_part_00